MSETQAPLNPEVETETAEQVAQVETEEAETVEEVPQPDYSKLLQKEQMARANLEKKMDKQLSAILEAVKSGASEKAQATNLNKLKGYLNSDEGRTLAASNPGLADAIATMAEEASEAKRRANEVEERQTRQADFDDFMTDKPSGFREAYVREQRRLMDEVKEDGLDADETALGIAMAQWTKRWMKSKTAPAAAATATGVGKVTPTAGAKVKNPPPKPTGNPFGWTV